MESERCRLSLPMHAAGPGPLHVDKLAHGARCAGGRNACCKGEPRSAAATRPQSRASVMRTKRRRETTDASTSVSLAGATQAVIDTNSYEAVASSPIELRLHQRAMNTQASSTRQESFEPEVEWQGIRYATCAHRALRRLAMEARTHAHKRGDALRQFALGRLHNFALWGADNFRIVPQQPSASAVSNLNCPLSVAGWAPHPLSRCLY